MLKNLKSLFYVEDEEPNNNDKGNTNDNSKKDDSKPSGNTPPPLPTEAAGAVDKKIVDKLLNAIEKSNLDGFDYLEFKKALKALEKMPMDEATKYRSAFATASTIGASLDKLVSSANFYISVLDKEESDFTKTFDTEFTGKIKEKEDQVKQFEQIIKDKSAQIKRLTEEIAKHQKQAEEIKVKLVEGKDKLAKTKLDFKSSLEQIKKQLLDDIAKMNQYLK